MKNSTSLDAITKPLSRTLSRFHLVIFVLVVAGGLALAIFSLHRVINVQVDPNTLPAGTSFDKETMERIEDLQTRENASTELNLPSGRTNPLAE